MAEDETQDTGEPFAIREPPDLAFGPTQAAIFASIAPIVEAFAQQHGMGLSREFDRDPLRPFACYFLKPKERCFVRICAADPFANRSRFKARFTIYAQPSRGKGLGWEYSPDDGQDMLRALLEEAAAVAEGAGTGKNA